MGQEGGSAESINRSCISKGQAITKGEWYSAEEKKGGREGDKQEKEIRKLEKQLQRNIMP